VFRMNCWRYMNLLQKVDRRLTSLIAVAALIAVAGNVLVSCNSSKNHWPALMLPSLATADETVNTGTFASEPAVINFWASWCVACREDHPLLEQLSADLRVFGVNHLDNRDDALRWLAYFGDPYVSSVYDADGRIGEALGVDALPVSLVIDAGGVIHYRHLGPLDKKTVETIIRPLVEDLRRK